CRGGGGRFGSGATCLPTARRHQPIEFLGFSSGSADFLQTGGEKGGEATHISCHCPSRLAGPGWLVFILLSWKPAGHYLTFRSQLAGQSRFSASTDCPGGAKSDAGKDQPALFGAF